MANTDNNGGSSINAGMRPEGKVVNEFHSNDDLDKDANAHHHSLGSGSNQAASGAHRHDGTDSLQLLEGVDLAGSRGTATAINAIIAALVQLGASDSTTA